MVGDGDAVPVSPVAGEPPPILYIPAKVALVTLPVHHMTFLPRDPAFVVSAHCFVQSLGIQDLTSDTPTARREVPKITLQFHNSGLTEFRKAILCGYNFLQCSAKGQSPGETRHDWAQAPHCPSQGQSGGQHLVLPALM